MARCCVHGSLYQMRVCVIIILRADGRGMAKARAASHSARAVLIATHIYRHAFKYICRCSRADGIHHYRSAHYDEQQRTGVGVVWTTYDVFAYMNVIG